MIISTDFEQKKRGNSYGRKEGRSTNWFTRLSRGKKIALCISGVIICLAASAGFYVTAKLGKVKREVIPKERL